MPRLLGCGKTADFHFVVMTQLGRSLSAVRKDQHDGKFSLPTACELGIRCLRAIQALHRHGVLHRDVKPSNFVLGRAELRQEVYVVDFGLARFFKTPDGRVRGARAFAGFRGTARYASMAAHDNKELARRDDLWSFFFMMVEFVAGQLPWRRAKEKAAVRELKLKHPPRSLLPTLPAGFARLLALIEDLGYYEEPDYDAIEATLADMIRVCGQRRPVVYEWDRDQLTTTCSPTSHLESEMLRLPSPDRAAPAHPQHSDDDNGDQHNEEEEDDEEEEEEENDDHHDDMAAHGQASRSQLLRPRSPAPPPPPPALQPAPPRHAARSDHAAVDPAATGPRVPRPPSGLPPNRKPVARAHRLRLLKGDDDDM